MGSAPRIRPRNADELRALIQQANAEGTRLCALGGGSKRPMVASADPVLDLGGLSGITLDQPEELVMSLRAGTPLDYVEMRLAERRQMLAFEPPNYAKRLGTQPARSTIGGVIASGIAGPRRLSAGNVRDHLLGFEAVSGRGEAFRAGGRVIKNVTGYDLAKLMAGSWGTLAVLTDVTVRVLPRPEFEATVLVEGPPLAEALAGLRAALGTALEVSCAAHLPNGRSALRLEGFRASVIERVRALCARFEAAGAIGVIEAEASAALWQAVRDLDGFALDAALLWRVSLPASAAAAFVSAVRARADCEVLIDWGGALVWVGQADARDARAVRELAARHDGHAWLLQASDELRASLVTAPRQLAAIEALSARVKQAFDPNRVLGEGPYARSS